MAGICSMVLKGFPMFSFLQRGEVMFSALHREGHLLHSPEGVMFSKLVIPKSSDTGGGRRGTHSVSALLLVA